MARTVKLTELFDPNTFDQYKDDLANYFGQGGTWKDLLHYDDNLLQYQYKKAYDLYQQADYKNAAAAFSYLLVINPYDYNYWMGLGISKHTDKLYEEALVSYTAAEAVQPDNPIPHLHLAQCFYALNNHAEAIEHLQKATALAGNRPEYQEVRLKASTLLQHLPK